MTTPTPVVDTDPTPPVVDASHDQRLAFDPIYAHQREQERAAAQRAADRAATPEPPSEPEQPPAVPLPLVPYAGGTLADLDPDQLQEQLRESFEAAVARLRTARGTVHAPEDVHAVVRAVFAVHERADQFRHAFDALMQRAVKTLEEELIEGVGDQDGIPTSGMTVPCPDGTQIKLTPDTKTERTWDRAPAVQGVAVLVDAEWRAEGRDPAADPAAFAVAVTERALDGLLTKSGSMSVTGVQALANELGARELDQVAGIVRTAEQGKTTKYLGVKAAQVTPKARTTK